MGAFSKFLLMICAIILFAPLFSYLSQVLGLYILIGIAGLLLIIYSFIVKRRKLFLLLGAIVVFIAALNFFEFSGTLIAMLPMDLLAWIFAGIGLLLILTALRKEPYLFGEKYQAGEV